VAPEEWTQAIVQALAEADESMTERDIAYSVGQRVRAPGPAPIQDEISFLSKYDLVEVDELSRQIKLTEQGHALARGFKRDQRR